MVIAQIFNDRIVNAIEADSAQWAIDNLGGDWIIMPESAGIGWNWDGITATPPAQTQPEIPKQVRVERAERLAQRIALQKQVEASLVDLPDDELETITYLFDEWQPDGRLLKAEAKVQHEGVLYQVVQPHNTQADWIPDLTPALFTRFRDPAAGPQPWTQPTGAQDAYDTGERVAHDNPNDGGVIWIYESAIDANTTEPGRDGTFDRYWTPIEPT